MPKETYVSNSPPNGTPGTTLWFDTSTNFLKYWNDSSWVAVPVSAANGIPPGGEANALLMKNSASDYDTGWTADPVVKTLNSDGAITSTGTSTFGKLDVRRNNAGGAVPGLQSVGTIRGLGYDGANYQVLANFAFGSDQAVTPTQSGGYIQFGTTPNGAIGVIQRLRISNNGKLQIPGAMQIGQPVLTDPNVGTVLDLSNGLFAERRQAVALVAGNNDNIPLPISSFVEFTGASGVPAITGFAGGKDGMVIDFVYLGALTVQIIHNAASVAANQINTLSKVNESSYGPCSGTFRYNASISKWVLTNWVPTGPMPGTVVQEKYCSIFSGWGSGNMTTYAIIGSQPEGWGNINKKYAGTNLEFSCGSSCFVTGGASVCYIAASPTNSGANSLTISQFFFNTMSVHSYWSGLNAWTGLAAGYYTCSFWVKVGSAVMSFSTDGNDIFWGKVREIWP